MAQLPCEKDTSDLIEVTIIDFAAQAVGTSPKEFDITQTVTKSGYTPIGIAGYGLGRIANVFYSGVKLDSSGVHIMGYNNTGSQQYVGGKINVMWKKNS